ncbi:MAG: GntR family transcriptional regulator YhfZ [Enterovibrio sp.]
MNIVGMSRDSLKKQALATQLLSDHVLQLEPNSKLEPIAHLAKQFGVSVGLLQSSMKQLEHFHAITLIRKGHLGTYINQLNVQKLLNFSSISSLLCVMPLPYTKRYEGLASGLKNSFSTLRTFNFAFMRGAALRADCLAKGHYHYAIVSALAAPTLLEAYPELTIALKLPPETYVARHQLIASSISPSSLAIDNSSLDQKILTHSWVAQHNVELLPLAYSDIITSIQKGIVDGGIINSEGVTLPQGLLVLDLPFSEEVKLAGSAVLLCRRSDLTALTLAKRFINPEQITAVQQQVLEGLLTPHY